MATSAMCLLQTVNANPLMDGIARKSAVDISRSNWRSWDLAVDLSNHANDGLCRPYELIRHRLPFS